MVRNLKWDQLVWLILCNHIHLPGCQQTIRFYQDCIFLPKDTRNQERGRGTEMYVGEIIMIVHGIEAVMKGDRTSRGEGMWKDPTVCCLQETHFKHKVGGFLQNEIYFYHMIQQSCSLVFTQRSWKLCLHKNVHTDVYSSFIYNCKNLEATKMSFSRWMDK